MAESAYGSPLVIRESHAHLELERLSLGAQTGYDEDFIQKLAFEHPSCLPIAEIDIAYDKAVPICRELSTPAGPMDAFYVTPTGRIVVLEAKLWRNPEARRKVVAQILDYAKELSRWTYEDLQRETSRNLGRKGNALFELVREQFPDTDEARFVDGVQRSLKRGRFLLLIVGDGIREGAAAIADFLESVGSLEFTFGLVELGLYSHPDVGLLVQPRVLARTVEFRRSVVVLPDGASIEEGESAGADDDGGSAEREEVQEYYRAFWTEFLDELQLDDVSQPPAKVSRTQNIFFALPPGSTRAWVSAYFMKSRERVGVYFRVAKGEFSQDVEAHLEPEKQEILEALGPDFRWRSMEKSDQLFSVSTSRPFSDVHDPANRAEIKAYFAENINKLINTFRPRMKRYTESVQ